MIDPRAIAEAPSPCYLVDEGALRANLEVLADLRTRSGAKVLLALKGFAMHALFPLMRPYLDGACASGYLEARLAREEFGKEVHTFAPAFSDAEFDDIATLSDHVVFNSFAQWHRFKDRLGSASAGLRVNPEHSEAGVALYDPCAPGSRLGVCQAAFAGEDLVGISGLHFHVLCEQNVDALERTLQAFESRFGAYLADMEWVNFGGGHHITRVDYDLDRLVQLIIDFRNRYGVEVILEPGEAVALNTGVLVGTVLDIVHNERDIAVLDISCTCHMPDVLEMPYRPELLGAGRPGERPYTYRLGGLSCLAGDVIGDYSFDAPLASGFRLVFLDMAHYTMVKTTMFNGVGHPAIASWNPQTESLVVHRHFVYEDFKQRLS